MNEVTIKYNNFKKITPLTSRMRQRKKVFYICEKDILERKNKTIKIAQELGLILEQRGVTIERT